MPKDEFDFEDPFELNGMAFLSPEDTTNDMAECFTEEFMRMGYNRKQILALFRNRQYLGPNMAFEKRGEPFIRDLIAEVFARRGKGVTWPSAALNPLTPTLSPSEGARENRLPSHREPTTAGCTTVLDVSKARGGTCGHGCGCSSTAPPDQTVSLDETLTDPMGAPIPKLNV